LLHAVPMVAEKGGETLGCLFVAVGGSAGCGGAWVRRRIA
jgi:hypothetical protein